jgi:hypothetical protein
VGAFVLPEGQERQGEEEVTRFRGRVGNIRATKEGSVPPLIYLLKEGGAEGVIHLQEQSALPNSRVASHEDHAEPRIEPRKRRKEGGCVWIWGLALEERRAKSDRPAEEDKVS